jgi:hypothetical protein
MRAGRSILETLNDLQRRLPIDRQRKISLMTPRRVRMAGNHMESKKRWQDENFCKDKNIRRPLSQIQDQRSIPSAGHGLMSPRERSPRDS